MIETKFFHYDIDFLEDIHGKRDTIILSFTGLPDVRAITIKYAETDMFAEYQFLDFLGRLGADLEHRYGEFHYLMSFMADDTAPETSLDEFIGSLQGYSEYNAPISVNRFLNLKERV